MCDFGSPMMGNVLVGAQTAGAVYSTVGSYYAAKEKQAALRAQAGLDEINARLSERSAQQALRSGQLEEQKARLKNAAFKGSQRASLAANGVDLGSDSAIAALTTTDWAGEIDAKEIATNALRTAWGYRTQGVNYSNNALLGRAQASSISPWMSAGQTLLSGATDVANTYYMFNKYTKNTEGSRK